MKKSTGNSYFLRRKKLKLMNHEYSPTDTTYNNFSGGKRNIYNIVSLRKTFKLYKENVRRSQC